MMLPADQFGYFRVAISTQPVGADDYLEIAKLNPRRIGIIISKNNLGPDLMLTTDPNSTPPPGGILCNVNSPRVEYSHTEYGPLVSQSWYGAGVGASGKCTVVEVMLEQDPCPESKKCNTDASGTATVKPIPS